MRRTPKRAVKVGMKVGQDRYAGPIMHPSEYIGGALARDILAEPGVYVAIVADYSPEDDEDENPSVGGWAVAKLKSE